MSEVRFNVPVDEEGGIAALEGDREPLEEVFHFDGSTLPPSTGVFVCHDLQEFDGVAIPPAEGFDDEGLEEDSDGAAVVEVGAIFGRLPHLDGSGG